MVFHFDISGNDFNDVQFINTPLILVTFLVSHIDISGNEINDEHSRNISSIVVTFLYFVVFQFYTKGYTGGKKLLNIKVESTNGELKLYQLLIRSLIINGIITSTLTVILLFTLNKASYINVQMYVELLNMGLLFVSFGMMLYRKDGRGLHDLLGGTKVVLNK